ncbi:MAG: SPOR domain-containing protein [Gallionella sp.]
MAKQLSADEQNLRRTARRRLIGAFALTLAVVVILPMVLESEPGPTGKDIELQIPSADEVAALESRMPPAEISTGSSAGAPESAPVVAPVSAPAVLQPAASIPEHRATSSTPTGAAPNVQVATPSKPVTIAESFVVQVGAYSNVVTARQELASLKKWGFKAYNEKLGDVVRVRVGPYAEREKADKVRDMLGKHGLHAVVMNAKS